MPYPLHRGRFRAPLTCTILAVDPDTGAETDTVRITCSRVTSGATVTIGGAGATVTGGSYGINGYMDVTVPAGSGAADVVVTDVVHGTDTLSGGFTYSGSAPTPLFISAWSNSTGQGTAAVTDGSAWGGPIGNGSTALTVLASTGLDFPTTNVLQVDMIYTADPVQEFATRVVAKLPGGGAWSIPTSGNSLYFRLYKRFVYPHDTSEPPPLGNNNHCVEEQSGSGTNWSWSFHSASGGWNPRFQMWDAGTPRRFALGGTASPTYLSRNATYRLEWRIHRTGATTWEAEVRIYNSSDVLLYDTSDFSEGATALSGYSATFQDVNDLDGLEVGTNGPGFDPPNVPTMDVTPAWYISGVGVLDTGWCGAYGTLSGES